MTMVTLEFEVDTELWEAFCKICEENGVTPEEAIVRFFEETAALQDLPFDPLPEDLEANPKLRAHIEERRRRREAEGKK